MADVVKRFGVDQPMDAIFLGKAFDQAFAMLEDALDEVAGHPDLQRAIFAVGKDVDMGSLHRSESGDGSPLSRG
ncbi:hypothetical protein GCM10011395_19770 [Sphingomonas psychrolutea]|uniref:Uncharacterized protein n=1 Tax=Sphingomonas psychrolutea TaxID=1259676 RepID=A0ABQ1GSK6_9SPHN|nr:hypothetical protein GCM10011395_19770 [Sphingomonas psychrolutea]